MTCFTKNEYVFYRAILFFLIISSQFGCYLVLQLLQTDNLCLIVLYLGCYNSYLLHSTCQTPSINKMNNESALEEEKQDKRRRVVITTTCYNNTLLIEKVLKYKHSNYWIPISS